MSTHTSLSVATRATGPHALVVAVGGDLDYDTGDTFLTLVACALDTHAREHGPTLRHLRLDCADLGLVDSVGLSTLLMLRRRTHPAGIALHLDNRPLQLARLLDITGTGGYLTESRAPSAPGEGWEADGPGSATVT
ncbi:STAS domain-containing protein [Streptomyces sp. NPDC058867]|uniref:STAS domain-containing protein n=1 Tax=unclassified Streptomyces TaxID=2593676 RepID=UPI0036A0624C